MVWSCHKFRVLETEFTNLLFPARCQLWLWLHAKILTLSRTKSREHTCRFENVSVDMVQKALNYFQVYVACFIENRMSLACTRAQGDSRDKMFGGGGGQKVGPNSKS